MVLFSLLTARRMSVRDVSSVLLFPFVVVWLRPFQIEATSTPRAMISLAPNHIRVRAAYGSSPALVCNGSVSTPDDSYLNYVIDVYWEVNGKRADPDATPQVRTERAYNPRLNVVSNKLTIKNYTQSSAGYYICYVEAIGPTGHKVTTSDYLEVRTMYSPFIVVTDHSGEDYHQREGETALIECGVFGSPLPQAAWYRGNATTWHNRVSRQGCRFIEEERGRSRPKSKPGLVGRRYALQIDQFSKKDVGWYTCVASTDGPNGKTVMERVKLTVNKPPVVNAIRKMTAEIGSNATLSNMTLESVTPVEVSIEIMKTLTHDFRTNSELRHTHDPARFVRTATRSKTSLNTWAVTVILLNVTDDDRGVYTFVVSNKAGSARYTTWLNMT